MKDAQRVTFSVARGASGAWAVSEVGRRPFVETTTPPPKPPEIPILSIRLAGRIVLKSPSAGPEPVIRDVTDFVFDAQGQIAFLRRAEGTSQALVVVDQQGNRIHSILLDPAHAEGRVGWSGLTCVGAGRFLLIGDDPKHPNQMEGALVDVATGKVAPVAGFTTAALSKIAGFPDGGFVVKGGLAYSRYTSDESLHAFDGRGKRLWSLPGNGDPKDPAALFSLEAVTVTTEGKIAVVDVIRKTLQFFDRSGKHHHTVDLKKAWGREPSYPSDLSADRDGGVVVGDFQGDPPIVRMNADGTVRAQMRPRLKDGRTFRLSDTQVAPDGALWVCDGHALFRLLESGVVDRVLGEAPEPRKLDQVATVTLDGKGQIYAAVGRTGAVHVFGPDGRWLRVCVPATGDVPEELPMPHLTVANAGDVYLGLGSMGSSSYLHFSPEGKRIGIASLGLDDIHEDWYCQPGTDHRWVLGYEKVYLVDGAGKAIRTVARRADRLWLERPETASVAPDGSIAVVSRAKGAILGARGEDPIAVSLYSPQGEPIRTFTLPSSIAWSVARLAYDGQRVVVVGEKEVFLFDVSGKVVGRFNPPQKDGDWLIPLLVPGKPELLLFDGRNTLGRFGLP